MKDDGWVYRVKCSDRGPGAAMDTYERAVDWADRYSNLHKRNCRHWVEVAAVGEWVPYVRAPKGDA